MTGPSSTNRRLILALCGVGVGLGVWFAIGSQQKPEEPQSQFTEETASGSDRGSHDSPEQAEPDHSIAERGRLTIDSGTWPEGSVVSFGLGLEDEAHTGEPLTVRVVSLDGRSLDLTALPTRKKNGGVRLEIDAAWLEPGQYMIQLKTTEKNAFPVRRYVLEVQ